MAKADIRYATGAVHDELGPVTSFVAETDAGREALADWAGPAFEDGAIIETAEADLVIESFRALGLVVKAA